MLSPPHQDRRALILDFDGVVVDTEWLHFESWNATFAEQYEIQVGGSPHQLVGFNLVEIFDVWRTAASPPLVFDADEEMRLLTRKTELFFEIGAGRLTLINGVLPLIQKAQDLGWYIGIASRSARLRLLRTLALTNAPAVFDVVMAYEDVVNPETDRKEHARAAAVFGISPANCVVIEDSASGVRAALDCGIGRVIGLTTSLTCEELLQAGAHQAVETLNEVCL